MPYQGWQNSSLGSHLFQHLLCAMLSQRSHLPYFPQDTLSVSFGTLCSTPTASTMVSQTETPNSNKYVITYIYPNFKLFEFFTKFISMQKNNFHVIELKLIVS